jgi:hypothetical protein
MRRGSGRAGEFDDNLTRIALIICWSWHVATKQDSASF